MSETRKVVAILVAEVVGCSRLAGTTESARSRACAASQRSHRSAIAAYRGLVVNAPGTV
jgi:hypothetical protein